MLALSLMAVVGPAVVGAGGAAASAAEATVTVSDPVGDVPDPAGDITSFTPSFTPSTLTLETHVASTAWLPPGWYSHESFVAWALDSNNDGGVDAFVFLVPGFMIDTHGHDSFVMTPDGQMTCPSGSDMGSGMYRVRVDPACFGSPTSVRAQAVVMYDRNPAAPGTSMQTDVAPDGWSGRIFSGMPFGSLDTVAPNVNGSVTVSGWAADPNAATIGVHVYVDGGFATSGTTDVPRGDVGASYPEVPGTHGFAITTGTLAQGTHTVCAYAINTGPGSNTTLGCSSVFVDHTPRGSLDDVSFDALTGLRVRGWALDPDTVNPINVHLYVDGAKLGEATASQSRDDIAAAFPGYGPLHGYDATFSTIAQGTHTVCAYGINTGQGSANTTLGCRSVTVDHNPTGSLDGVHFGPDGLRVRGWALDPDTVDPINVHVYVDGAKLGESAAGETRDDIAAAFPGYGPLHGYDAAFPTIAQGTHTVCAYGINTGQGNANTTLGCRSVTVEHNPIGSLDAVTVGPTTTTVSGWALDRDSLNPIAVHIYVDGVKTTVVQADELRGDIAAAFPAYGAAHGLQAQLGLLPQGTHTVCAYAINVGAGTANTTLGCRTVTVEHAPIGSVDGVVAAGGAIQVRGWALDPDTTAAISVHVYVDGSFRTSLTANRTRDDIAAAFPGYGTSHGYDDSLGSFPAGAHTVCMYAINTGPGSGNVTLGCRTVST